MYKNKCKGIKDNKTIRPGALMFYNFPQISFDIF